MSTQSGAPAGALFAGPGKSAVSAESRSPAHLIGQPTVDRAVRLLAITALALPWLVATHQLPWTGFHAEMAMAVVCAAIALGLLRRGPTPWWLPAPAVAAAALAVVPAVQYLSGQLGFFADAWVPGLYLLAFAFAILVGARIEARAPGTMAAILLGSFVVASFASLVLAADQWLQSDRLIDYLHAIPPGSRPSANVGQPNKLAMLLIWGLVGLGWMRERRVIGCAVAAAAAAALLFGIVMTRSRFGTLGAGALLVAGFMVAIRRRDWRGSLAAVLLGVGFATATLGWSAINDWLQLAGPQSIEERLKPGTRPVHWQLVVQAIAQRPITGWGWQQVVVAQQQLAPAFAPTGEIITYAHNLVLDLLVWNGVPIGGAMAGLGLYWFGRRWATARDASSAALMLALTMLLLYAMLELPHAYATFLLPAGMMIGAVEASRRREAGTRAGLHLHRGAVALLLGALLAALVATAVDYLQLEEAYTAERLRRARIGNLELKPLPQSVLLDHLSAVLANDRVAPTPGMSAGAIEAMQRVTERMPGYLGLLNLARAQALNGQQDAARTTLARLCHTHPEAICEAAQHELTSALR